MELRDLIPQVLYSKHPNLATIQMQLPYAFPDNNDANFIKELDPERLQNAQNYIQFNEGLKTSLRPSLRTTYTMRGLNTLVPPTIPLHHVKSEFERFLFKSVPSQRGTVCLPLI
jgi:hypothetical protein